jgi:serine/threonine protein phosphatase 1
MKAPATLPPGQRLYVVSDIHGLADRLATLHALIEEDAADYPVDRVTLVYLGDYVDRGPDSRRVIEMLLAPPPVAGAEAVHLLGNHERLMLDAIAPPAGTSRDAIDEALGLWLLNGGAETMDSYGMRDGQRFHVPREHIAFLRGLKLSHAAGGYVFVHAGVLPGVPLDQQDGRNLVWIREPFLSSDADHGATVVHGHTPIRSGRIEVRPNRIGIDTAAVFGGPLTCLVLEGDQLRTLTA